MQSATPQPHPKSNPFRRLYSVLSALSMRACGTERRTRQIVETGNNQQQKCTSNRRQCECAHSNDKLNSCCRYNWHFTSVKYFVSLSFVFFYCLSHRWLANTIKFGWIMSIWFCNAVGVCTNSVNTTNIKSGTSSILVETWFNFAIAMMSQSICYCRCCGNSMSKIFHVFMLRWACGLLVYWEIMILWCVIAMCFCGHSTQFSLWQSPTRLTRNAPHTQRHSQRQTRHFRLQRH